MSSPYPNNEFPLPPKTVPVLQDDIVHLRPFVTTDVPALLAAAQTPDLRRWMALCRPLPDAAAAADWIMESQELADSGNGLRCAVTDKDTGAFLGCAEIGFYRDGSLGVIGYWTVEEARGRGIAVRSAQLLCTWALTYGGCRELMLGTMPGNVASERVAVACGFERCGISDSFEDMHGDQGELLLWSRLPEHTASSFEAGNGASLFLPPSAAAHN